MYNIIDHLKNNKYFVVVLACVVVVLFLNSRTIVEGLTAKQRRDRDKKKKAAAAKAAAATATAVAAAAQAKVVEQQTPASETPGSEIPALQQVDSQPNLTPAIRQEIDKQIETQVDKQLKFQVDKEINKTVPTLIDQKNANINRRITGLNRKINNMKTSNLNMEEYIKNATSTVDGQIKDSQSKLVNTEKELINNLQNQYTMHKTGLEQLSGTSANSIQTAASDIKNLNQETINAKDEAKKFMGMSEDIYNKTLNLSTGMIIKNDINARTTGSTGTIGTKESFATLNHYSAYDNVKESFDVYTNPTSSGNLFDLEKDVIDKLNDFNQVYYDYIKCSAEKSKCVSGGTIANVNLKAKSVQDAIANLQSAYGANKSSETIVSDASFNQIHTEILTKSQSINELRTELDSKMQKIIDTNNRIGDDFNNYDSTVYAGIAWSILATSLVFFIFTEL
jgi:Spy/CpxP family protein refolding chaperone